MTTTPDLNDQPAEQPWPEPERWPIVHISPEIMREVRAMVAADDHYWDGLKDAASL